MFVGIQLLGLLFVAVMIYLTYLNYKRHNYGSRSFISWLIIWFVAGIIMMLPKSIYNFMDVLSIERIQDFFFVGAFIVLFVVVFHMYVTIKKTHSKVERLVREEAIRKPISKTSKKSSKKKK